jgi:Protein of unknown function (DUF2793)
MSQLGPNMGIFYDWPLGEFYKTEMDANLKLLDMINQLGVLDKDLTAPPGGPANGDRYIVAVGATGAWATHDLKIAVFIESTWEFHTPLLGWGAYVSDEGFRYDWNGVGWVPASAQASFSEAITETVLTGAVVMDLSLGRNFRTSGAIAGITLSFINIPANAIEIAWTFEQDVIGGHLVTFPGGTQWPGGTPIVPSLGSASKDEFLFRIVDGGTIQANVVGQAYA